MPASPALTVHSHRGIDADTGIQDSLNGLLVDSVSVKVSTNRVDYMGGLNQKQVMILNNKTLTLSIGATVLERAGVFSHNHPGTAIHRGYVTEFHDGLNMGFDTSTEADGYFIYMPESSDPQKGEYDKTTFTLELWEDADASIDVITAPSAP
jgi:hypothetical protein